MGVVNVAFPGEANAKKRIDFLLLMYLKRRFRLSNGESCMQALVYVFNLFRDGALETTKGDRGLSFMQLLGVILDLVHSRLSKEPRPLHVRFKREEKALLPKRISIFIIQSARRGPTI